MKQVRKLSLASLTVIVLLVFGISLPREQARAVGFEQAEPDKLQWTQKSNGFTGVYTLGNKKFSVESYNPSPDFSLTRIGKAKGITLLEILRNGDIVTVTLADAKVSFNFSDQSSFTDEEQIALQTALDSVDAIVARRISAAAISQLKREGIERKFLVGLGAASIVLGSDSRDSGKKADISSLTAVVPEACAADNCLGCCGSGCSGCIGCCTDACRRHDECVRRFGQFRCLLLLPAAIASIFLECFV